MRISANSAFAYVDYVVSLRRNAARREPLLYSCYNRSEIELRSFGANISLGDARLYMEEEKYGNSIIVFPKMPMDTYHIKLSRGKEPLYHSVSMSRQIGEKYILTTQKRREKDIYNWLMTNYDLPLLESWISYLLQEGKELIKEVEIEVFGNQQEWMQDLVAYEVSLTGEMLQEIVSNGLKKQEIFITKTPQNALEFDNMDDYFMKYGTSLIENLEKKLNPLVELKETVDEIAFLEKRFYPQQAAIVNGLMECMRYSSYAFLNEDMGCGKTLQGMGVLEGFFNRMIMEQTHKSIKEIYSDITAVKYRNIIMCPPHLVNKWADAIRKDIPYAKVVIIRGLKELCKLRKRGKKRTAKEFYILSKETGKLSYTYEPLPSQRKNRTAAAMVCQKCKEIRPVSIPKQCACGCTEWEVKEYAFRQEGMVCPECGLLLYSAEAEIFEPTADKNPLRPSDFATQTRANRICRHCGTPLWKPACDPINRTFSFMPVKARKKQWVKMTHYANKAKKNKKSVWVNEKWKQEYIQENGLDENEIDYPKVTGVRKYAPSRYIKKYLRGFFDFAIFDEAHEYKGGGSAQGMAMHDLVKASRWQLALTGTIAGGYASHFFYLLYRLDPARMKAMGFSYGSEGERKFVEHYGTVATEYEVDQDDKGNYNAMSRGRQLGSPKCRPGISSKIFTDFLLDKAVFLNLSDMSSYLPPLLETVVYVPLEDRVRQEYNYVRDKLKTAMYEQELGKSILGTYLQFSLSYTDKPYGRADILSPIDGSIVVRVPDLSDMVSDGKLLNKEKKLCEIIQKEISEERNVFVYCEYTGHGEANITQRLREVMQKHCGLKSSEVEILESSFPSAEEREEWMHERASKGVRVFITNPKCVKTGLDFLFYHKDVMYNFPTIVFYQYSYDLFTMWQASRRHYRLNQVVECRTFYMLSENTIQMDALEMVASKQVATSAIQGHFSSEGLCAMAQGVDPRIKLAQAASEKSPDQMKGLKSMFDVLNQWHAGSGEKKEYRKMLTFYELTGTDYQPESQNGTQLWAEDGEKVDLYGLFGFGVTKEQEKTEMEDKIKVEKDNENSDIQEDTGEAGMYLSLWAVHDEEKKPIEEEAESNSLFDLFGSQNEIAGLFQQKKSSKKKVASGKMQTLF